MCIYKAIKMVAMQIYTVQYYMVSMLSMQATSLIIMHGFIYVENACYT